MQNIDNQEDIKENELLYFKAFIRVVKSINSDSFYNTFGSQNVVEERLIRATNKDHVKKILLEKYPQFFPNNKIYSKETKDDAQFFYVIIYELYNHEKELLTKDTSWKCEYCNQHYENSYLYYPNIYEKMFGKEIKFCNTKTNLSNIRNNDDCLNKYIDKIYKERNGDELPDDLCFVKTDSINYIYKITEKKTNKCYIGKTRNAPFFRWWNHLTHSSSPFGIYFRNETKLSDWTFEVLEELPSNLDNSEILSIESKYILEFDSINNGYNTVISKKTNVII